MALRERFVAPGEPLREPFVAPLLQGALEQGQRNRARMAPPGRRGAMSGEIEAPPGSRGAMSGEIEAPPGRRRAMSGEIEALPKGAGR